jgi:hypothetical protein
MTVPTLLESRAAIIAALEARGIRTATAGKLAAPCVLVEPGDPWSEPQRVPGRVGRWRLSAIAGRTDTEAALAALATLVDEVDAALRPLPGVQLPTWGRPFDYDVSGIKYAATVATIQYAPS